MKPYKLLLLGFERAAGCVKYVKVQKEASHFFSPIIYYSAYGVVFFVPRDILIISLVFCVSDTQKIDKRYN